MKIEFKKSFLKELKKLKNRHLKDSIFDCVTQVESAQTSQGLKV